MSDTHITIPMARLVELETAEHERDIYKDSCEAKADRIDRLGEQVEALRAQVEALRADAERYRWLRRLDHFASADALLDMDGIDTLDAAIDAAREGSGNV